MADTVFVFLNDTLVQTVLENTVNVLLSDTIVHTGLENAVNIHLNDTLPHTHLDILAQVEAFYDHAMNRIEWLIGIGFALVGILWPTAMSLYQRKTTQNQIDFYKNQIDTEITRNVKRESEKTSKIFNQQNKKSDFSRRALSGMVYQTEGNLMRSDGEYQNMLNSYLSSLYSYSLAQWEEGIEKINLCIVNEEEHISAPMINEAFISLNTSKEEYFATILEVKLSRNAQKQIGEVRRLIEDKLAGE